MIASSVPFSRYRELMRSVERKLALADTGPKVIVDESAMLVFRQVRYA